MGTQPEARLQRRIRKRLKEEVGGKWIKIWGGPFTEVGISDILGCCGGLFFAFEAKTLSGSSSEAQDDFIIEIRTEGGVAEIVRTPEEAIKYVKRALQKAGRSSEGRGRMGRRKDGRRIVIRRDSIHERLQNYEVKGACWEFLGHKNKQGYGRIRYKGKLWRVSRLVHHLLKGPVSDDQDVLHSCDNPPCINPDHLFLGTDQDNVDDRERKGRGVRLTGERHWRSKITEANVRDIRRRRKRGEKLRSIGKRYSLTPSQVNAIAKKRSWKHVA